MATHNEFAWRLALAAITCAILLAAMPASAQTAVKFGGTSSVADAFGCNDNGRCVFLNVTEGRSAGVLTALLFYDMSWFIDPIQFDLSGFGNIPTSTLQITDKKTASLNVDTSTVSGFMSNLCSFNVSTGEFLGCSPQFPVVTLNLHNTRQFTTLGTNTFTDTFLNTRFHSEGTFSFVSATGGVTIADQSFANVGGDIGTGQNQFVSITLGRP